MRLTNSEVNGANCPQTWDHTSVRPSVRQLDWGDLQGQDSSAQVFMDQSGPASVQMQLWIRIITSVSIDVNKPIQVGSVPVGCIIQQVDPGIQTTLKRYIQTFLGFDGLSGANSSIPCWGDKQHIYIVLKPPQNSCSHFREGSSTVTNTCWPAYKGRGHKDGRLHRTSRSTLNTSDSKWLRSQKSSRERLTHWVTIILLQTVIYVQIIL